MCAHKPCVPGVIECKTAYIMQVGLSISHQAAMVIGRVIGSNPIVGVKRSKTLGNHCLGLEMAMVLFWTTMIETRNVYGFILRVAARPSPCEPATSTKFSTAVALARSSSTGTGTG